MEVAGLQITVDASSARKASTDLDDLTGSAKKTESASGKLGQAVDRLSKGLSAIEGAIGRVEQAVRAMAASQDRSTAATSAAAAAAGKAAVGFRAEASAVDAAAAAAVSAATATQKLDNAATAAAASARAVAIGADMEAAALGRATAAVSASTAAHQANAASSRMAAMQNRNLLFQLNDIGVSLASGMNPLMVAVQQGSQIATIYEGGIVPALRETARMAGQAAIRFAPLGAAIGAVGVLLYGFTRQINEANDATVSMADTAIAIWESLASTLQRTLGPAFTWLSNEFNRAIDQITRDTSREINTIIGLWVGSVEAIKAVWTDIPGAIGYVAYEASRNVSNAVVTMASDVLAAVNDMFSKIDEAAVGMGGEAFLPRLNVNKFQRDNYKLGPNPYQSAADSVAAAGDAFSGAQGKDYVGGWMAGVGDRAVEISKARNEVDALGGALGAANDNLVAANDNIYQMTDALRALGPATIDPITLLQQQMADLNKLVGEGGDVWAQYGDAAFRAHAVAGAGVLGLAGQMTGALSQMFEDNKGFAVANAVVSTAEAVMKALATYGPTPWGFAAAGVAAATGAAQVAAIMSAQKGSASVTQAGGGSAGVAPSVGQQRVANVTIVGDGFSGGQVSDLLKNIAEGLNTNADGASDFVFAINRVAAA